MQQTRYQRLVQGAVDGVRTFVGFPVVSPWIELDLHNHDLDRRRPRASIHEQPTRQRPLPEPLSHRVNSPKGAAATLTHHDLYA